MVVLGVSDVVDRANDLTAFFLQLALQKQSTAGVATNDVATPASASKASNASRACVDCGETIEPQRLKVLPATPICSECAKARARGR